MIVFNIKPFEEIESQIEPWVRNLSRGSFALPKIFLVGVSNEKIGKAEKKRLDLLTNEYKVKFKGKKPT